MATTVIAPNHIDFFTVEVDASGNGSFLANLHGTTVFGWQIHHVDPDTGNPLTIGATAGTVTIEDASTKEVVVNAQRIASGYNEFPRPVEYVIPEVPGTPGDPQAVPPIAPTPAIPAVKTGIYFFRPRFVLRITVAGVDPIPAGNKVNLVFFTIVRG